MHWATRVYFTSPYRLGVNPKTGFGVHTVKKAHDVTLSSINKGVVHLNEVTTVRALGSCYCWQYPKTNTTTALRNFR